jgi:hypothetical protein
MLSRFIIDVRSRVNGPLRYGAKWLRLTYGLELRCSAFAVTARVDGYRPCLFESSEQGMSCGLA